MACYSLEYNSLSAYELNYMILYLNTDNQK